MKIVPKTNHFTAIVIEEDLTETYDGFLIAKNPHSHPMMAKIIELSDTFDNSGLGVAVGDIVLLPKYGSTSYTIKGDSNKYQLCHRLDIIGIV